MKLSFSILILTAALAMAADEPLIPTPVNNFLRTIERGMTLTELKKSVASVFPASEIDVVMWRGPIGVIDYKLEEHLFLRVYLLQRDGKELVDGDLLCTLTNPPAKRQIDIKQLKE